MFLSDGTFEGARTGDRSQILLTDAWPSPIASSLALYPSVNGTLATARPLLAGSATFAGDPTGFTSPQSTGGVNFATGPVATDTVLAGQPQLDLVASVTAARVHLIATLYDESPAPPGATPARRRISQFAINPELRNGIDTVTPVIPGVPMPLQPPGFAMAHNLRAGHRLVLRVTASDPDKVPTFAVDPAITVHTGPTGTALRVPVMNAPSLAADTVPLELQAKKAGPAQATIRGYVTPASPGGGTRLPGVTSEVYEFIVDGSNDNAALIAGAVPAAPAADVDLYLQRQQADGTWSGDIASGTSGSLTEEQLRFSRPAPGRYRVEAHNWAGPPATRIDLTLTFVNSDGTPGS